MSDETMLQALPTAIIGGGLAGLAAAVALAQDGGAIALFEARQQLGGRATSFRDPTTGETLDHCQHVSMGCCTNLADLCRRLDITEQFQSLDRLTFVTADGRRYDLRPAPGWPAPLHFGPSFLRLGYLTWSDRLAIGRTLLRLARWRPTPGAEQPTIGAWLAEQRASPAALAGFWEVVLVSALGETLDRAALPPAQKVFVDGFMTHPDAARVLIPQQPLGALFGTHAHGWLAAHGVSVHLGTSVERLELEAGRVRAVVDAQGRRHPVSGAIVALPWRPLARLLAATRGEELAALSEVQRVWFSTTERSAESVETSPITGVHLVFDRVIAEEPALVFVGTLAQWLFRSPWRDEPGRHGYQIVISASRNLPSREALVTQVVDELRRALPTAQAAQLLHARVVTEQGAVFSITPECEARRPMTRTPLDNLCLAGDWTATGWPATMEGAVRSGYRAAEVMLAPRGAPAAFVVPDRGVSWLARRLCRIATNP